MSLRLLAGTALASLAAAGAPSESASEAVQAAGLRRLGSFLVIGDWGWDPYTHGDIKDVSCQRGIGERMTQTMKQQGDVRFVLNVGDSFYPAGLSSKDDRQWDDKWRRVYSSTVRSVPWYSVYGNHDLLNDPCACSDDVRTCTQYNPDVRNLNKFYMPDTSYYLELPELQAEVLALDMNFAWADNTCQYTKCKDQCRQVLKRRADAAFALFNERIAKSKAKNLLVFTHYPTDYFWGYPDFMAKLSNATDRHIEFFGGHRHNVDQSSTTSIAPNNNWLSGGGGGWSCDGDKQGFLLGEIFSDGSVSVKPVLVDPVMCCTQSWWWRGGKR